MDAENASCLDTVEVLAHRRALRRQLIHARRDGGMDEVRDLRRYALLASMRNGYDAPRASERSSS